MIRTQIQLTQEQYRALKRQAAEKHVSLAEVIRRAVSAMPADAQHATSEERRRRALKAAGRYGSGRSDVSARHDDYLADTYGR